jgi:hypothetical protein
LALLHHYFLRQYIFGVFLYKFAISHVDNGTASIQSLFQNVLSECYRHFFEIYIYRFSIHSAKVEKINTNAKKKVREAEEPIIDNEATRFSEKIFFKALLKSFNHLTKDHNLANIKIEIEHADNMTENQLYAFVKKYFSKR